MRSGDIRTALSSMLDELREKRARLRAEIDSCLAAGNAAQAEGLIDELESLAGEDPELLAEAGRRHLVAGRPDKALETSLRALSRAPADAVRHHEAGLAIAALGFGAQVLERYLEVAATSSAGSQLEFANILLMLQRPELAAGVLQEAAGLDPRSPRILENLAFALRLAGRPGEASRFAGRAALLRGRAREAALAFGEFSEHAPADPEGAEGLARALREMGRHEDSLAACRDALQRTPGHAELLRIHAQETLECGRFAESARIAAEAASRLPDDPALRMQARLSFPRFLASTSEADAAFTRLGDELRAGGFGGAVLPADAMRMLAWEPHRYAFYLDRDVLPIQAAYGRLVKEALASAFPGWTTALPRRARAPGERIRIGYLSGHLGSTAGSWWALGWLSGHRHDEFEVSCYHLSADDDSVTPAFRRDADTFRSLPRDPLAAVRAIRDDRPDILVILDAGADPLVRAIAGLRAAPVQCAGWGFPVTTGIETVDYCLSSELMEPADAEAHYVERLVRLPGLGVAYPRPHPPRAAGRRADFGLPEDAVLYASLQAVSKYLPEHDHVYAAIAARVPAGRFIFLEPAEPELSRCFRERLHAAFAARGVDGEARCLFVPELPAWDDYMARNLLFDVVLDTFGWSGCVTSLDALSLGLPIVTAPGRFRRGRQTSAMFSRMGITDTVASGGDADYVDIAVRLGLEPAGREALRRRLLDAAGRLFDDQETTRAVEAFYRGAA